MSTTNSDEEAAQLGDSEPTPPLGASRDELEAIFQSVGDGITVQGPGGELVYANDAAARLCGLNSGAELLSLSPTELRDRFEIIAADGSPLPLDQLPNRQAYVSRAPESGVVGYRVLATGDERWSELRSTPIFTDDEQTRLVINVFRDITDERRAEGRVRFLAEASALLSASLDYEATLADLARLLVPQVADYCIVDALADGLGGDGHLREVVISHRDPEREELLRELRRRYPPEANEAHPVSEVLRSGEPYLVEDSRGEALAHAAVDDEHLALYHALEAMSYIVVPLEARGRVFGTISLGTGESGRRFGPSELELAGELARRAAVAIDNALLFQAAQESFAQLDTLLVSAPVGIGFWDRDLRYIRVNDALAALNRLPPEEHVGRTLAEVLPTLAPVLEPLYRRVLESGEPIVHTESTDERALVQGDRRHWLSSYYPVRTPEGEVIGVGGVIMEITDRKRADDRLRLLAEAGELFSSSLDGEEIAARIARVTVPGLADSCTVYLAVEGSLEPVARVNVDRKLQPLLDSMQGSGLPVRALGSTEPILERSGAGALLLVPILARDEALGVIVLGAREPDRFDVHDLELAQELSRRAAVAIENARLVRELERRAQSAQALEFVGDGVFLLDRQGVVRLWNPAAERITGRSEAEVVGAVAAVALRDWPLEQVGERPQAFPIDGAEGELWLSLTAAEFPDGTVFAFRDLTEERQVDRLKSDFVSTVSHELRTPLAAIYGAAMTLNRDDVVLNETQREGMLNVVAGESERLARIVNDILLASRLDSGVASVSIGRADAAEIARGVLAAAETHLPEDTELSLSASESLPDVAADADGLRQVLVNLVENAVKYSPDGGPVEVALEQCDGRVRFSIRDHGLGIPAAEHGRIFEKFYRLDPNLSRGVGGTGLGLYICREILQRMGSRIQLESEPGRGSTFSFELPVAS